MRPSVPSSSHRSKESCRVLRGGRSLGIAAHWQPVLRMYMRPLATSRRLTVRLLPPRLAAGISRDQWCDQRPFLVGQVTWVAQLAPVVATTVLTRPHQRLPPDRNPAKGITPDSQPSRCFRMDT